MAPRRISLWCRRHLLRRKCLLTAGTTALLVLAGCATPAPTTPTPAPAVHHPLPGRIKPADVQCVPYARNHSAVKIFGDAYLWWARAKGRYSRHTSPTLGSIMVLDHYAGRKHAHLAIVRSMDTDLHQIHVDHSNWLNDGNIHLNDAVRDVSRAQNWSEVRVFDLATHRWGSRAYHVRGFIGPDRAIFIKQSPKTIADLIAYLSPQDLPRSTAPGINFRQVP